MNENKAKNYSDHASKLAPGLYVVATPIGNLKDITLRALEVLKQAEIVYCEDTRTSARLMRAYGITTKLLPYHEHNAARKRPVILEQLQGGHSIALISDAGTPAISDPGYKLIAEAREKGLTVIPLPGACAAITALSASGLPSDRFLFCGFLPSREKARKTELEKLKQQQATLVFYESPRRLAAMLQQAKEVFGAERRAVVARELTKQYESFYYMPLEEMEAHFAQQQASPKGELVVLIEGNRQSEAWDAESLEKMLLEAIQSHSVKDAAHHVAELTGQSKRALYQRALSLKSDQKE